MEPFKNFNEAEECHSSESGWTMYIGSPLNGTEDELMNEGDFDESHDVGNKNEAYHEDEDTDDSMASDASSGPSHKELHFCRNSKSTSRSLNQKGKGNEKGCSNNKVNMLVTKNNGFKNEEKEESIFSSKGAKVPSNGGKLRKSIWKGKGK